MKKRLSLTRRGLFQAGTALAVGGAIQGAPAQSTGERSYYERLGVNRVINATGTVTNLGGSVMPPEVVAAWVEASRSFVNLAELQNKVGERIAKLVGVEAAMITTGAAGALFLGTAAAITGNDPKLIARLPNTTGLRNEVILQKSHHSCYDNQLTGVGAKLIDVENIAEAEKAINKRTTLMFYMNKEEPETQPSARRGSPDPAAGSTEGLRRATQGDDGGRGQETRAQRGGISRRDWIEIARRHKVPTLLDAAADVPPVERLSAYNRMGFDLVAFSGGKAMRGPNDTGLLLGRKDLVEAAKRNANPNCGTIGRMMKVSKEDTVALLAAVERFVNLDHKAEWKELERRIGIIEEAVRGIPTVQCERIVPWVSNEFPHLQITWDEQRIKRTRTQFTSELMRGDPPIQIGRVSNTGDRGILISVVCLQAGEEKVVADRVRAALVAARQT